MTDVKILPDLDLISVRYRLERDYGWSQETLDRVETEYRLFLALTATQPAFQPVPTQQVDGFWHYHILDTGKYAEDCLRLFGTFIHHAPETETPNAQAKAAASFNLVASQNAMKELAARAGIADPEMDWWPGSSKPKKQPDRRPSSCGSPTPAACSTPAPTPSSCYSPPSSCGGSSCGGGGGCGGGKLEEGAVRQFVLSANENGPVATVAIGAPALRYAS